MMEVSLSGKRVRALQQDQLVFVEARCEPASMSRVRASQEEAQCTAGEILEMRSMTGSLHWVTGGTRPDESFATSQLQRKQSEPLVSDHKRAVQTIKRLIIGQPEIGLKFRPLSTKMCVLVYTDSALHNADADPDEGGSDDEWLARAKQKGICVRSQHGALVCVVAQDDLEKADAIPVSFMTWTSKASKRTILSTIGAEASACRDALDLAAYTRAKLCEVLIGDEWTEKHLPIRVVTDCKRLFDCLTKDARDGIDSGIFARKLFGGSGKRPETFRTVVGADTSAGGGRTDKVICWSLFEKCFDFWNRSAPRGEHKV